MAIGDAPKTSDQEAVLKKIEEAKAENREKEIKSFRGVETVNGVEISVAWDEGYKEYTIDFPQISLGDEAQEQGISDRILRIDRSPETAKLVFDYAYRIAKGEPDVYKIFKKVETFITDVSQ